MAHAKPPPLLVTVGLVLLALESCSSGPVREVTPAEVTPAEVTPAEVTPAEITPAEVEALMAAQRAAWNRGDLETFVSYYDSGMTFLGGKGLTKGTGNLLENYRRGYPTAADRGRLTFELVEFRPLGVAGALVLGRYAIERAEPASGYFTLLVIRGESGLRIAHDHTSASPPTKPPPKNPPAKK